MLSTDTVARSSLPSNIKSSQLRQADISKYARVTKPNVAPSPKNSLGATKPKPESEHSIEDEIVSTKKRKRDTDDHSSPTKISRRQTDPLRRKDETHVRLKTEGKATATHTRPTGNLLIPERTPQESSYQSTSVLDSTPKSPVQSTQNTDGTTFSKKCAEFVQLVASLLKALSLYLAHHGSVRLVDCRELARSTTKIWRKRRATLEDIRRCAITLELCDKIAQEQKQASPWNFRLIDEGRNKLYLECKSPDIFTCVHEAKIKAALEELLSEDTSTVNAFWEASSVVEKTPAKPVNELASFSDRLVSIPHSRAPLTTSKGQDRLTDLLLARKHAKNSSSCGENEKQRPSLGVRARSQGLLARMAAKEERHLSESAGPSPEQLKRIASLHRIADLAYTLSMPHAGNQRLSYTLPTITKIIQNSLHIPLSADEIQSCLRLLADELAIGFVKLIESGGVTVVVVDQAGKPIDLDARVRDALSA